FTKKRRNTAPFQDVAVIPRSLKNAGVIHSARFKNMSLPAAQTARDLAREIPIPSTKSQGNPKVCNTQSSCRPLEFGYFENLPGIWVLGFGPSTVRSLAVCVTRDDKNRSHPYRTTHPTPTPLPLRR